MSCVNPFIGVRCFAQVSQDIFAMMIKLCEKGSVQSVDCGKQPWPLLRSLSCLLASRSSFVLRPSRMQFRTISKARKLETATISTLFFLQMLQGRWLEVDKTRTVQSTQNVDTRSPQARRCLRGAPDGQTAYLQFE